MEGQTFVRGRTYGEHAWAKGRAYACGDTRVLGARHVFHGLLAAIHKYTSDFGRCTQNHRRLVRFSDHSNVLVDGEPAYIYNVVLAESKPF